MHRLAARRQTFHFSHVLGWLLGNVTDPTEVWHFALGGAHARVAHSTVQISAEWRALFNFVTITHTRRAQTAKIPKIPAKIPKIRRRYEDVPEIMNYVRRLLIYDKMQKIREYTVIHHYTKSNRRATLSACATLVWPPPIQHPHTHNNTVHWNTRLVLPAHTTILSCMRDECRRLTPMRARCVNVCV